MSDTIPQELNDKFGSLMARAEEIKGELAAKADATRVAELAEEQTRIGEQLAEVHAEITAAKASAENEALMKRFADYLDEQQRAPSKAHLIGAPPAPTDGEDLFFTTVAAAKRGSAEAKAKLEALGSHWADRPSDSKATLGTTDGTGGFLIPNNVVSRLIEQGTPENPWRRLLNVQTGIRGSAVDVPTEGLAPTRASVVGWGDTKPNADLTVNNYTATLYTLAVIYDVANQFLRHSEGAAEALVRSTVARRLAQGEAYYILNGSGSSEPKGILTSIGTSGTFVTSFTASATTLAGSVSHAIAEAAGAVAGRNRTPTGAVVHGSLFWTMLAQGTDEAGYFFAPTEGPAGINGNVPTMRVFGLQVLPDNNMPSDDVLVGDFASSTLFIGDDYRVDVSTEAGDRWDKNLTGFRAEEEIAFNADPYVSSGFYQRITDALP